MQTQQTWNKKQKKAHNFPFGFPWIKYNLIQHAKLFEKMQGNNDCDETATSKPWLTQSAWWDSRERDRQVQRQRQRNWDRQGHGGRDRCVNDDSTWIMVIQIPSTAFPILPPKAYDHIWSPKIILSIKRKPNNEMKKGKKWGRGSSKTSWADRHRSNHA